MLTCNTRPRRRSERRFLLLGGFGSGAETVELRSTDSRGRLSSHERFKLGGRLKVWGINYRQEKIFLRRTSDESWFPLVRGGSPGDVVGKQGFASSRCRPQANLYRRDWRCHVRAKAYGWHAR